MFLPVRGAFVIGYVVLGAIFTFISIPYFVLILQRVGFTLLESYAISISAALLSLAFSPLNLVVKEINKPVQTYTVDQVEYFGIPFYIPRLTFTTQNTEVALNLGGAILPTLISVILMIKLTPVQLFLLLIDVMVVSLIISKIAKVHPGVGIVTPAFIPPIIAFGLSALLFLRYEYVIPVASYIAGVLGSLIGADLLNMGKVIRYSPPFVSIGGMGTFDGIYVTGILAVFLAVLIL
ncbi:membrane protein [Sulfolobales archaeon HS-7]|nr:membrane protein [Sulfolobales archaeon HS-7]